MLSLLWFQAASQGAPLFAEIGPEALPGVTTTCGTPAKETILEVNGGGLLLSDLDVDGDQDLVVVNGSTLARVQAGEPGFPPTVHLNRGDATFAPGGEPWAIAPGVFGMGGAAGDVQGDGFPDLVITEWGPTRLILNGGKGLSEATKESGFEGARWGTSAAFLDYDKDGALDLAVVNYLAFRHEEIAAKAGTCKWKGVAVMCGPEGLTPVHDVLYRGRGDGTFEDATVAAGYRPREAAFGLGVTTLDFDVDGDTDLYVTNDSTPNHLWENQGNGTFREVGVRLGVAFDPNGKEQAGMGIAVGDLNADGRQDLFVTNFSGENNSLYLSGKRSYQDGSDRSRLGGYSVPHLGWGTSMVDFDLDTDLDLSVFNGHVYPQADLPGMDTSYAQPAFLYRNLGNGQFAPEPLSAAPPSVARASAAADLDGDGWVDLVAIDLDGPVRVLWNRGREALREGEQLHWLAVRLRGQGKNRDALGARVTVELPGGAQMREIRTAGGYQSAVPPIAYFGLGGAARVPRIVARFPSGAEVELRDVEADRTLWIEEPAPAPAEEPR
jgi:hypothetical protein